MNEISKDRLELIKRELLLRRLKQEVVPQASQETAVAITPADRHAPLVLSWQQQRLWFLDQLGEAGSVYYINGALRLKGRLDQGLLQATLDAVIARHEVLRTTFVNVDGKPVQHIGAALPFALKRVELVGIAVSDVKALIAREAAEEMRTPFDLAVGPLLRGRLLRLAVDDHVLLITMHHIISDGWSMSILGREVGELYAALWRGETDPLPALSIQYADYAKWQQHAYGERFAGLINYWREHLRGAPALLELPGDRPRPAIQSYVGGEVAVEFDADLTAGLNALARRHGATLFMVLYAGWAVLLSRLSGQDEVVIGTPVANRPRRELEALIGFFVNTLALRTDLTGNPAVGEFIERIKAMTLDGFAHQEAPFEQVVEALNPERSLSHSPLFQVMFALQNAPMGTLRLPEVTLQQQETVRTGAHFDLGLSIQEADGGLRGSLEYASDLFDAPTIKRWQIYLETVLRGMVADETQTLGELSLLSPEERARVLYGFNATRKEYPDESLIHEQFKQRARRTPDAVAVISDDMTLTYGELDRRANQLAHALHAQGVRADQPVAIFMERSPELIVALLGILQAGGACLALNPEYPADRLLYMLEDAAPKVLLTLSDLRHRLPATQARIIELDREWPLIAGEPTCDLPREVTKLSSRNLASIIYTSGSTGQPKGVMIEHRSVVNLIMGCGIEFQPDDCVVQCANPAFDASALEIWGTLFNGARLLIMRQMHILEPETFLAMLRQHGVSMLFMTTGLFRQYVRLLSGVAGQLRYLVIGGETTDPETVRQALAHPPQRLINAYGPTETTTIVTSWLAHAVADAAVNIPIGRPLANTQIYILDKYGQPVPVGVAGEIYIGGAGVARGYLNRPERTAESFVPDPFFSGRMYKTGDMGRWHADGNIEYLGRNDFQVKLRGFRIELGEIEARLSEHPSVCEAVVLLREDQPGQKRLVAYLTATGAALSPGAEELRSHLRASLPDYMAPGAYVILDALPLTPSGKVDRSALPMPDASAIIHKAYAAPQGEMEEALATIWAGILKLDQISRNDNFFDLGGHSLLAVQVVEKLRQAGLRVDVRSLFSSPVLSELALELTRDAAPAPEFITPPNLIPDECDAITPAMLPLVDLTEKEIETIAHAVPGGAANVQDIYPLAPLQEGILFHHLLSDQRGDTYVLPVLFAFDERPRLDAFLGALRQVIARHDVLRTAVLWEKLSRPVQVVYRHADLPVEEITLTGSDPEAELKARMAPEQLRIDLRCAPLLQVRIAADPSSSRWYALLEAHHLALDHVSLEIVVSETLAYLNGAGERLSPPVAYRGFVAQSLAWADTPADETFFRSKLGDFDEPSLPFGLDDIHGFSRLDEARETLAPELAHRLRQSARQLGVSAATLFHAAWALVIARTSGRDDVVFGSVLSGRLQGTSGADRVVGMFINTLPLRLKLAGQGVQAFVRATQRELVELIAHEQTPLALAQRASGMTGSSPLFSALLNYRHSNADFDLARLYGIRLVAAQEATNYPFSFGVDDFGDGFGLVAQVDSRIAAARVTAYMRTALEELVGALESTPERQILELSILPTSEHDELLHGFNATADAFPESLVHELFEDAARRNPDAVAVVSGDKTLSYGELDRRANQLAHHLRAQGVGPDQPVAICVERSLEMIVGLLGILKAGGVYVPLDPVYPVERLAYMLADAAPKVILTQMQLRQRLPETAANVIELDTDWPMIARQSVDDPDRARHAVPLHPHNLAYIIYTSGSTGQPKGVMVEHRQVTNYVHSIREAYGITASDRYLLFVSISFDGSVDGLFGALCSGAALIMRDDEALNGLEGFARICNTHGITLTVLATAYWQRMMADLAAGQGRWPDTLRLTVVGGEAITANAWATWRQKTGAAARLNNNYGPTETTVASSRYIADGTESVLTIGRPVSNTQIYILDAHGQPVPMGVTGEIYIGGAGVGRGYLNRPELTAERFLPDPFSAGGRMYKTGDLGRWRADGCLEYLGRNDAQIKLRGFRIEPGEIEACLAEHPAVGEVVVILREDQGEKRLVAYLTAVAGATLQPEELRNTLRGALPDYMVPSAFVVLDVLPLTPNGKVDRRALPVPADNTVIYQPYLPPQGETEEMLAAIWMDVLKVERVGRHDNFFDLGGHSLLAVQMLGRLREHCDAGFALRDLFEYPTLQQMAARLATDGSSLPASLVPLRAKGERRPLFLIHVPSGNVLPYVPLSRLLPEDVPVYGLQVSDFDAEEPLTVEALAARHIDAIRQFQPHGPYRLAGWSAGGLIAWEMANQLARQGETVEFLGLFDTYHPAITAEHAPTADAIDVAFLLSAVHVLNPGLDEKIASELSAIGQFGLMLEHCKALHLLPLELSLDEAEKRLQIYRAIIHATRLYRPAALSFPVHLFAVADELSGTDPSHGWQGLLGKWLRIQPVSGTHIKLMEPPHVQALAQRVATALQAAEAERT
jgi:amino acid adenylation domain-containing protein